MKSIEFKVRTIKENGVVNNDFRGEKTKKYDGKLEDLFLAHRIKDPMLCCYRDYRTKRVRHYRARYFTIAESGELNEFILFVTEKY